VSKLSSTAVSAGKRKLAAVVESLRSTSDVEAIVDQHGVPCAGCISTYFSLVPMELGTRAVSWRRVAWIDACALLLLYIQA